MTEETPSDHEEITADAEREAEDLKNQGDKLDEHIESTRSDWERKQDDSSVPGAVPDPDDEGEAAPAG
jgi:hypothetical protein